MEMPSRANSLEQALVLEQDGDWIVGGPIDADFLGLVGSPERRAGKERDQQSESEQRTPRDFGHDQLHA
jgi:hypothetical protein